MSGPLRLAIDHHTHIRRMKSPLLALAILSISCSGDLNSPVGNAPVTMTITGVQATHAAGEKVTVVAKVVRQDVGPVANLSITFLPSTGGTADPATAITDANGVATTTWTVPSRTGITELRANSGTTTLRATTDVKAGAAARINKLAGDAQEGFEGELLTNELRVSVTDAFGNPVGGREVLFVVTAGGGSVTAFGASTLADGSAYTEWRLGAGTAPNRLEVRTLGVTPATFTATSRTSAGTFVLTGSMSTARSWHTATLLRDGRVLVTGGSGSTSARSPLATAELYDPATGSFTPTANNMMVARTGHSATLLADGRVLIAGGSGDRGNLNGADLFDPATSGFVPTGSLVDAQAYQEGTLLRSGEVLIAGGWTGTGEARAELYDPVSGGFRYTGQYADVIPMNAYNGLVDIRATLLSNGKVPLASLPRAEVNDAATGTFAATGSMLTNTGTSYISGRMATLLINGKVLLTGGHHEDIGRFSQAELYDPSTGVFLYTMSMPYKRDLHTSTLLASGKVLIAGGESESKCPDCGVFSVATAEVYDANGTAWSAAAPMKVPRETQRATLLRDGRVLVTGGLTFNGGLNRTVQTTVLSSAELFTERP